ncbi:methyltransferase domain-containing protein [Tautonia rosea]|uniref:methyltransferase domain-containing protein n=1 Tax=Tautonia rosea TaxID=2728037 RepID=UPI00147502E1|nr:methyltransferase domain-containing protein [Tautonia rosea]
MRRSLHITRIEETIDRLRASGATSVLDLGCGSGRLLVRLLREPQFRRVAGLDHCRRSLSQAADALREELEPGRGRLELIHGSFTEPDDRLCGFDAAVMVETIEHLDPRRLSELERTVFRHWRPKTVVMTTPNRDFNALFDRDTRILRHRDHRFEWSRAKFAHWAGGVAQRNGYRVAFDGIGQEHPAFGSPTQLAEFSRGVEHT